MMASVIIEQYNENINDICYEIEEMAKYDEQEYSNRLLTEDYGMLAYCVWFFRCKSYIK
jgi:hypothetical protein